VPWGAGGTTDIQMRALADQASRRLGQPVIVENRPGAGGVLAAQQLLNERPDGHVLAQMPISVFRHPQMAPRPLFNPSRTSPTSSTSPATCSASWCARCALADLRPVPRPREGQSGKVNYGTPGVGTSLHITMEQIAGMRGIDWVHVPFRGVAENMQALLGGQIEATADSSGWAELVQAGRLQAAGHLERRARQALPRTCRPCGRAAWTSSPPLPTGWRGRRA
jgi:tripartite-type tricarboxylate transporter receptor subunit TctC